MFTSNRLFLCCQVGFSKRLVQPGGTCSSDYITYYTRKICSVAFLLIITVSMQLQVSRGWWPHPLFLLPGKRALTLTQSSGYRRSPQMATQGLVKVSEVSEPIPYMYIFDEPIPPPYMYIFDEPIPPPYMYIFDECTGQRTLIICSHF